MIDNISLIAAFVGGLVSFLSPCVLPIIPGFLAYLAGTSLSESKNRREDIFINSLFFVIGFSLIFAILGVLLNTILNSVAYEVQTWLSRIGGLVIIFFGLYLVGLLKVPFLEHEYKPKISKRFSSRYLTSFLFGSAFAAGWTPCVGIILGGILGLAAVHPASAFWLLFSYSIGLGIPFLVVGLFTTPAAGIIKKYGNMVKYINIVFGIALIVLGVLAFTQNLGFVANFDFVNNLILN